MMKSAKERFVEDVNRNAEDPLPKYRVGTTRKAAKYASELYLERDTPRTLKQCIAIAAERESVAWGAIQAYLCGVGARALLGNRDAEPLLRKALEVMAPLAELSDSTGDLCRADSPSPWRVTHGTIWGAEDTVAAIEEYLGEDEDA